MSHCSRLLCTHSNQSEERNTWRIVLLGKTGTGKSSLANTIFGEKNVFDVNNTPNSGTKFCMSKKKNINRKNIQLMDTPGLFDTDPESSELSPELLRCITECAPGPHAFLLVLKMENFTKQEQTVVEIILKYFSEEALKYTTVVFTHGDDLPEEMKIKEWVKQNKDLNDLVQKCGGRCHVFDNKHWNKSKDRYRNNKYQLKKLLKTIKKTVTENKGGYYTNELLQKVQEEIEKEKIHIKESSPNISLESLLKQAKEFVYSKLEKNMGLALNAGGLCLVKCVAGAGGAAVWGAVGGLAGAWLPEEYNSPTEAVQDAGRFLDNLTDQYEKLKKNEVVQAVTGVFSQFKSD